MPRPKKWRMVCCLPPVLEFVPVNTPCAADEIVVMTVDEYETIRLIDHEGFSQEECSGYMKIARTTVQLVYNNARKKIAAALVEGRTLRIEGGEYRLCEGKETYCGCGGCRRHRCGQPHPEREDITR
ncbi:MAG: DUF134 domain-containing protein [Clostridiales bacterium]|nr:DUF134 domain-containing protein [Clostridiales bacterium]